MVEDTLIEVAKTMRECYQRVVVKVTTQQLGEAFTGLDDRRHETAMRGLDRRAS